MKSTAADNPSFLPSGVGSTATNAIELRQSPTGPTTTLIEFNNLGDPAGRADIAVGVLIGLVRQRKQSRDRIAKEQLRGIGIGATRRKPERVGLAHPIALVSQSVIDQGSAGELPARSW